MQSLEHEKAMPSPSKKSKGSHSIEDFRILKFLGHGAYGNVYLAEQKATKKQYAMKQISKKKLEKENREYQALIQKELLCNMDHQGIVKLKYTFQDKKSLYFFLEYCQGGSLVDFITSNIDQMSESLKVFYVAQIVNILEYLKKIGVIHRDLKPQNLMLTSKGHLKLIDFGTADVTNCTIISQRGHQLIDKQKKKAELLEKEAFQGLGQKQEEQQSPGKRIRKDTFVGTTSYISPQLLEENYCTFESDLWALGCIIYQIYFRQTPFHDPHEFGVFQKIKECKLIFPQVPPGSQDMVHLISNLLKKHPEERLGSNASPSLSFQKLKSHPYFKNLNVNNVFHSSTPSLHSQSKHIEPNHKISFQQAIKRELSQLEEIPLFKGIVEEKGQKIYLIVIKGGRIKMLREKNTNTFDVSEFKLKGSISELPATLISEKQFELTNSGYNYFLLTDSAEQWVEIINRQFTSNID